jgi:hypothetical protein
MAYTEHEILEELRKQGITTLDELARRAAEDVTAKTAARGAEPRLAGEEDYIYTGKDYTFVH